MTILLASCLVASVSVIGILFFGSSTKTGFIERLIVPFAIGTFLGVTFFELIPETFEAHSSLGPVAIVSGFLAFYLLAHLLRTYHHHHHGDRPHDACETTKSTASLLLFGDAVHNFVDGIVIASAFLINPVVGWVTTFGIALHEVPQEIAEFGVLKRSGYTSKQAILYNFASASSVIVGAGSTLLVSSVMTDFVWVLTGVAAGNLLYVALSDLLPGVEKTTQKDGTFYQSFTVTILGLIFIVSLISWSHANFGHAHDEGDHEQVFKEGDMHDHEHEIGTVIQ